MTDSSDTPDGGRGKSTAIVEGADRGTRVIGASLTFVVAVVAMAYGGRWLDTKSGTAPLFLIVGALWGFVGGFLYLLKHLAPDMLPGARPKGAGTGGDSVDEKERGER